MNLQIDSFPKKEQGIDLYANKLCKMTIEAKYFLFHIVPGSVIQGLE